MRIDRKNILTVVICLMFLLSGMQHLALADPILESVYDKYPRDSYIVGIGEVIKTGSRYRDKRVAKITARVELARQLNVTIEEETLDIACEGTAGKIFDNSMECKNEFLMVIKQSVDQVLVGSRIVDYLENEESLYAIAVMERKRAAQNLGKHIDSSLLKVRENIAKAKEGDTGAIREAEKEYMKAIAYSKEKEAIAGVKSEAASAFEELEQEIEKLKRKE